VIVGAVAPYNAQTTYPENSSGDWIVYFQDVVEACGEVDGFAVHCYSRSQDQFAPSSESRMGGEFGHLHDGFRAYRDFLEAIPDELAYLPIYITETNPGANGDPWRDEDTGWVTAAHDEINDWNQARVGREVRCLAIYRHDTADVWTFKHKSGVVHDFMHAAARGYQWTGEKPPDPSPSDPPDVGECLFDAALVRQIVQEELDWFLDRMREVVREELDGTTWKSGSKEE
jgi:hypothetical protein